MMGKKTGIKLGKSFLSFFLSYKNCFRWRKRVRKRTYGSIRSGCVLVGACASSLSYTVIDGAGAACSIHRAGLVSWGPPSHSGVLHPDSCSTNDSHPKTSAASRPFWLLVGIHSDHSWSLHLSGHNEAALKQLSDSSPHGFHRWDSLGSSFNVPEEQRWVIPALIHRDIR